MDEETLLVTLAEREVLLACQSGRLEIRAPGGALDAELKAALERYEGSLCRALERRPGFVQLGPPSYNQVSLFFIHLLDPESKAYNLACTMRLHAEIDAHHMRTALQRLVARHEALRSTLSQVEIGKTALVCQFIAEHLPPVLEEFDAQGNTDAELLERVRAFHAEPIDVQFGPVIRAALFKCGSADYVLIVKLHHIAADGWSFRIIHHEIGKLYRDCVAGEQKVDEAPASYLRSCLEQREFLSGPEGTKQLEYWQEVFATPAPGLKLGPRIEERRPAVRRSAGATEYFEIDAAGQERINKSARALRVTPFTLLFAVFQAFLLERSKQGEVVVGIPTLGHRTGGFMDTVGYFVNPVALRSRRPWSLTFREHLKQTSQELKEALRHRDAPLAAVVERVGGVRDPSRTPVFQALFNHLSRRTMGESGDLSYRTSVQTSVDLSGITATGYPIDQQEGQFDLTLEFVERGPILLGLFKYALDLVTAEEAAEMVGEVRQLLERALSDPDAMTVCGQTKFHFGVRPSCAAILDWARPAAELEALVSALVSGAAAKTMPRPKIAFAETYALCGRATSVAMGVGGPPGTVTGIEANQMRVATGNGDLLVSALLDDDGAPLPWVDAIRRFALHEGVRLPLLDAAMRQTVTSLDEQIAAHEAFWVERLRDLRAPVFPYFAVGSPQKRDGEEQRTLDLAITEEVRAALAERYPEGSSREALGAAFALYVFRLCGGEPFDLGVCTPTLSARVRGWEALFSDRVPLRIQVDGPCSIGQACETIRSQLCTLEEQLTYAKDLGARYPALGGTDLEHRLPIHIVWLDPDGPSRPVHAALQLVIPTDGPAQLCYRRTAMSPADMALVAGQFMTFLETVAARPDCPLFSVPLLSDQERHRLLVEWNDTSRDYPGDMILHHYIERQSEATPDAAAVRFDGITTTYRELDRRANRLAHELRSHGVGPGRLVALYLERSTELVITLLAVLKAGGAYVPLDPSYPSERVAFMLEDTQAPVVVTQNRLRSRLPASEAKVLCVDPDAGLAGADSTSEPSASPGDPAYLIYTSGSTGKPKGVLVSHRSICNRLLWMQQEYGLTDRDRVMQKTPYSFDVSVWEFFWPLMFGACLTVARPEGHKDPAYLVDLIRADGITTLHFVPSMLRLFLEQPGVQQCTSIQRVICSGEALPYDLQQRFFERCSAELHNLYGPTEAAVDVTYWQCRRDDERHIVPIGRPVANTQTYVLDRQGNPTPVGVPGELHLGGVQIALGYLNRPELTKERFIPDPFSKKPDARLYRTGDLCRYLHDGALDFLGRLDFQVKVRGFRIELGEIEAALLSYPGIREAVVLARADELDATRTYIAAYLVAGTPRASTEQLRSYLAQSLPDYMVPEAFVLLDRFPLNPNGKLDRKALPAPKRGGAPSGAARQLPSTALEKQLAAIFCEVLRADEVGVDENFFDMGGDSLRAARIVDAVRKSLSPNLELVRLFEHPTIRALAAYIGGTLKDRSFSNVQSRAERQREAMQRGKKPRT